MTMKLPSPCISICQIDPVSQNCMGCYRTRQEIAKWPAMTADEQQLLLQQLKQRRAEKTGIQARSSKRRRQQG
jgi:predicted Fe-S protein YdhL (DUF1289 family)